MINIQSITARNFLSIGNNTQAMRFDQSQLTLIMGQNGSGKSSIISALSYALYGRAVSKIKRDSLINNINGKNMLVTVDFIKDNVKYRIERGRRPNILKFFINDKEQEIAHADDESQGDSRETQKHIVSLLGMSHDMFTHIVALNTDTEPFLAMRINDQRMIIEQLLGITLLSEKADLLKEQIRISKEKVSQETIRIETIKQSNSRIQKSIDSLKLKQRAWQKQKLADIKSLQESINKLSSLDIDQEIILHDQLKSYNTELEKVTSLNNELSTITTAITQTKKALQKSENEISKLLTNTCPMCGQSVHDETHERMQQVADKNYSDVYQYLMELNKKSDSINEAITNTQLSLECPVTFYPTLDEAYNHRTNVEGLQHQLMVRSNDTDMYQDQITDLESKALQEVSWDNINNLNTMKDHQEFLLKLLTNKDSFIRKKIIDQNLTYLNHRLTYYLEQVGLPHSVTFLNDLSVEISQLGQDMSFFNLSRGEKNRVILSLSFAFRDVWESLYHQLNLLSIDELIDNGLDTAGVDNSLAILKKIGRDRNKNIFLISHKDELLGRVNNTLTVVKENEFTSYESEVSQ